MNVGRRPYTTVVLAMSADGKIADVGRSPARFGSPADRAHLEAQIAQSDGVLFGAGTLRAYGTSLPVTSPAWLEWRSQHHKPPQPVHIVCSRRVDFDPDLRFFRQPIPRWLLTPGVAGDWQQLPGFDRVVAVPGDAHGLNWTRALEELQNLGLKKLAIAGGGSLVAGLLAVEAIDELWLTICPLLLGGDTAPTPVGGAGFCFPSQNSGSETMLLPPQLSLLEVKQQDQEIFLHYRVIY